MTCLLHHLCALVRKRGHVESGVFWGITMLRTNRTSAARLAAGLRAGLSFGTLQVRGAAIHVVAANAKRLHRAGTQAGLTVALRTDAGARPFSQLPDVARILMQ